MENKNENATNIFYVFIGIVILVIIVGAVWIFMPKTNNDIQQTSGSADDKQREENKNGNNIKKVLQAKTININEKQENKDWEITIKKSGFTQDVKPSNPGSYYTHYQVDNTDNTYFYLILEAKNISNLGLRADKVAKVKMIYDNKYEYNTFSTIEYKNGESFTYTNITDIDPLTSGKLYYLVEVPKAIGEDSKPVKCEITVNENQYIYNVR